MTCRLPRLGLRGTAGSLALLNLGLARMCRCPVEQRPWPDLERDNLGPSAQPVPQLRAAGWNSPG